jgi:hypothetical protein
LGDASDPGTAIETRGCAPFVPRFFGGFAGSGGAWLPGGPSGETSHPPPDDNDPDEEDEDAESDMKINY